MNKTKDFYDIYHTLSDIWEEIGLDAHCSSWDYYIWMSVVRVNPLTKRIEDNESLNTEVCIWLEWGFPYVVNVEKMELGDLDHVEFEYDGTQPYPEDKLLDFKKYGLAGCKEFEVGGKTYEEAVENLVKEVLKKYKKGKGRKRSI